MLAKLTTLFPTNLSLIPRKPAPVAGKYFLYWCSRKVQGWNLLWWIHWRDHWRDYHKAKTKKV